MIQPVAPDKPGSGELPTMLGGSCASIEDALTAIQIRTAAIAATIESLIFIQ